MRARTAVLLTVLVGLLAPSAAHAEWQLAPDGHPLITPGWSAPDQVQLSVCPPGDACTAVTWTNREYRPGETAVGTTFEVRRADARTERSPAWQGQARPVSAPTLSGRLYATGSAQPHAGEWTGGWGDDVSVLSLHACVTAAGTGCSWLPQLHGCPEPCVTVKGTTAVSDGGVAGIPAAFVGRYLLAAETRVGRDTRGQPVPLGIPAPTVIVEPVPPPTVTLRTRALRSKGRLSVGRITCLQRCTVSIKVSGGGRKVKTSTFAMTGSQALRIAPRRGKLAIRVRVDGKLLAKGRVKA